VTTPADERVTVGLVRGLHGLRGAVRVEVLSDVPDRFAVGSVLFVDGDTRPLTVVWSGPAKVGVLVRFGGVDSRETAEPLRDRYLEALAGEPLSADTWYWHQIQGLEVTTTAGHSLGQVADVFRAGGGEVYVVRGGPLGELLVPAVRSVVVELDPSEGRMVVDPVALDLPDKPPRRRRRQEVTRRSRKAARAARATKAREAAEGRGVAEATDGPEASDTPSAADPRDAGDAGDAG
jgi:16S rRNA processing protein RimM